MAAPKGNKFALGNSGKSKQWTTPEDLQKDIDAYFDWCKKNPIKVTHNSQIDKKIGKPLVYEIDRPYTIEGLCLALDCSRETLINYEKQEGYEEYFDTIKKAKLKIQQNKVEKGITGTGTASVIIFDLKNNHGYKDKTESDVNQNVSLNLSKNTIDDISNKLENDC